MSGDTTGAIAPIGQETRRASFWRDLSLMHVANGLVGFLFAASGPLAIVLAAGTKGGLSEADLASWVFGSLFVNGMVSIIFCLRYRQPLVFFWTIPGTVLIAPALSHLSFAEVIGAYVVTGLLMTALGLAGWVQRAMQAIPMPVVMGMVAGVFLAFGLDWVRAFQTDLAIAVAMTATYFAVSAVPALATRLPPLIVTLAVGAAHDLAFGNDHARYRCCVGCCRPAPAYARDFVAGVGRAGAAARH